MTTQNLIKYEEPKLLTEREVRLAGATSCRTASLRGMLRNGVESCTVSVKVKPGGTIALPLPAVEAEAMIAFLKERDELFLTSLNIELEA
jgi:hypothetical protein